MLLYLNVSIYLHAGSRRVLMKADFCLAGGGVWSLGHDCFIMSQLHFDPSHHILTIAITIIATITITINITNTNTITLSAKQLYLLQSLPSHLWDGRGGKEKQGGDRKKE